MKVFMNMRLFMKILNKQTKKNKKGNIGTSECE